MHAIIPGAARAMEAALEVDPDNTLRLAGMHTQACMLFSCDRADLQPVIRNPCVPHIHAGRPSPSQDMVERCSNALLGRRLSEAGHLEIEGRVYRAHQKVAVVVVQVCRASEVFFLFVSSFHLDFKFQRPGSYSTFSTACGQVGAKTAWNVGKQQMTDRQHIGLSVGCIKLGIADIHWKSEPHSQKRYPRDRKSWCVMPT